MKNCPTCRQHITLITPPEIVRSIESLQALVKSRDEGNPIPYRLDSSGDNSDRLANAAFNAAPYTPDFTGSDLADNPTLEKSKRRAAATLTAYKAADSMLIEGWLPAGWEILLPNRPHRVVDASEVRENDYILTDADPIRVTLIKYSEVGDWYSFNEYEVFPHCYKSDYPITVLK